MNIGKAAETKYVSDAMEDNVTGSIENGICYTINELRAEYNPNSISNFTGIVILKRNNQNANIYDKFTYIASDKYYYNSVSKLEKIDSNDINSGNSSNLKFKNCCEYYKSINSSYNC